MLIGCIFAKKVPARKLKLVIATIAIFAGLQLVWTGSRSMMAKRRRLLRQPAARLTAAELQIDAEISEKGLTNSTKYRYMVRLMLTFSKLERTASPATVGLHDAFEFLYSAKRPQIVSLLFFSCTSCCRRA